MAAHANFSIATQLRSALNLQSVRLRVIEISKVFSECSLKELQVILPQIVDNIFGISTSSTGWNIKRLNNTENYEDAQTLIKFLHPQGVLFDVLYKLLGDAYTKYEYNVAWLPGHLRESLEEPGLPTFFTERLQLDHVTRQPQHLLLNPYEYYMMHFAYHLVSPWHQRPDCVHSNTVYITLCDLYSSHLMPIETSTVLPQVHLTNLATSRSPPPQSPPLKVSSLFKASAVQKLLAAAPIVPQPHAELWRSELWLIVVIYIWLNVPPSSSNTSWANQSSGNVSQFGMDGLNARASGDHLRVVRQMMKHVHFFVNNLRNDGTSMDEMRRSIRSVLKQSSHAFLKHNISVWPLDSSFSLTLETYLTYVQPWRYLHYQPGSLTGRSANVDNTWLTFISDNLEIYSSVIRQLISRFTRMDLSSQRHAHMLYRLCKVLSEPDLPELLYEAERLAWLRGELDENHSIFSNANQERVTNLLTKVLTTIALLREQEENKMSAAPTTFLQKVYHWLNSTEAEEDLSHQVTVIYLDNVSKFLCKIFQVEVPDVPSESGGSKNVQPTLLDPALAQKRSAYIKYMGNPDERSIRADEWAPLVRMLHKISSSINEIYSSEIAELWYRQDTTGRLSRQLLAGPCQTHRFLKTGPGKPTPLLTEMLPPRVCLRPLASHKLLSIVAFLMLMPHMFAWSPPLFYVLCGFFYFLVILAKACILPYFNKDPGQQEQESFVPLDISFNE